VRAGGGTLAYNPRVPPVSDPYPAEASQPPRAERAVADRCPGVLRLVEAADGHLARVRLPGGFVTAGQLRVLARLAGELGDGRLELTSRGNLQLRALAAGAAARLTGELAAAGLVPSVEHDRVRNVLASPLAGLDGGPGLAPIVRELDEGLCARPGLAGLSGRFLFAIDDGRGDVAGLGADVVAVAGADGGTVNGLRVAPGSVATVMLSFAEAFAGQRAALAPGAWRIADLPDGPGRVRAVVATRLGLPAAPAASMAPAGHVARPVGVVARNRVGPAAGRGGRAPDDGTAAVVLLAPLGRLTAGQADWLAGRLTGRAARVTPWRSVVLPDQADPAGVLRAAAALGLGVDDASPWLRVTACAGKPGCASALADVQADAVPLAARWPGRIVHVSGCGRRCGRPAATEIDVTATSAGYQVAAG